MRDERGCEKWWCKYLILLHRTFASSSNWAILFLDPFFFWPLRKRVRDHMKEGIPNPRFLDTIFLLISSTFLTSFSHTSSWSASSSWSSSSSSSDPIDQRRWWRMVCKTWTANNTLWILAARSASADCDEKERQCVVFTWFSPFIQIQKRDPVPL